MIGRLNDLLIVCTAAGWPGRRTGQPEQGQEVAEKRALLPRKDSWPRVALRVGCSAQARLMETENGAELPVFPFEVQDPIQRSKVEALPQRISSHSARPQQPLWSGGGAGTVSGGEPVGLSSDQNCRGIARAGLGSSEGPSLHPDLLGRHQATLGLAEVHEPAPERAAAQK